MSALGESFRTARESQGLSLSDVAERIHIRSVYLAAIEAEDWQSIGPAVYVKGFVRSYARFLGLDPDAAIARVAGSVPAGVQQSAAGTSSRDSLRPSGPRPLHDDAPKRGLSLWAGLGIAVAVLLVGFVGYQYIVFRQADAGLGRPMADATQSPVAVQPSPPARASQAATSPKQPDLEPPVKNEVKSSGFAVRLRDSSWLRVTVDGKVAMEGLFAAGTRRSFAGHSAIVRVGNAGGVDVTVGGKDLGPMGGIGDVAERSYQL